MLKGMRCKVVSRAGAEIAIGRVIDNPEGSVGGKKLFVTPHGTFIETGYIYLKSLNARDLERLIELEKSVTGNLYDGKLTAAEIEEADKAVEE